MQPSIAPNNQPQLQPVPIPVQPVLPPTKKTFLEKAKSLVPGGTAGLFLKVLLGGLAVIALLLLGMFILTITNLDVQFFKAGLYGVVTTEGGTPIPNVIIELTPIPNSNEQLSLNPISTISDSNGNYSFGGLNLGEYEVDTTVTGFESFDGSLEISRSFLNYDNFKNLPLVVAGFGNISGKFITENDPYSFVGDTLLLDGEPISINPDGTFNILAANTGLKTIKLESISHIDITKQFQLESGDNLPLEDILLDPAGDLFGNLTSHIRQDIILDFEILVQGVSGQRIDVEDNGDFFVRDLEIGKTYTVRAGKEGYETRDYEVTVVQGLNQIPEFRVVEEGSVPFLSIIDRDLFLFTASNDGENTTQLTFDDKMNPFAEFIDGSIIYYLSDRDGIRNPIGRKAFLVYAVSTQGGNARRITTNTEDLGRTIPNFKSRKLVIIGEGIEREHRKMMVMDLTGNDRVEIEYLEDGVFNDVLMSNNGAYVFYYMQNSSNTIDGLYRANAQTGESTKLVTKTNTLIYAASQDGDRVIYSASSSVSGLSELYMFTVSTGEDKRLFPNEAGRTQFQFIGSSRSRLMYQGFKDGANNVFELDVDTDTETRLTNFRGAEGVEAVYQQSKYILYQTNRGLYIMDSEKPISGVSVTRNVARYTGYDF